MDDDHGQPIEEEPARTPPHSIQAEASVLGAMILSAEAVGPASDILKAADFYRPAHQEIFAAVTDMALRGVAVDLVTLREEFIRRKRLKSLGGMEYIVALVEGVPAAVNVKYYAAIVRRHARARDLIIMGAQLTQDGYNAGEDPAEVIHAAQMRLYELSLACEDAKEDMELGKALDSAIQQTVTIEQNPDAARLLCGLEDVDSFCGGFLPGEVVTMGGRTGCGKSTFACNMLATAAKAGKTALMVSGEMPAAQIAKRFIQSQGQIWGSRMRQGQMSESEWEYAESAAGAMRPWKIQVIGKPMSIPQISVRARQLSAHWNRPLDLLVIDYLQVMKPHEGKTIREQMMAISRDTKQMALELPCVVLLLSQFSRPPKDPSGRAKQRLPTIYDLRESGTIEQDADFVLLLHKPEPQPPLMVTDKSLEVWLRVGKGRDTGDTDWPDPEDVMAGGIRLRWYPGYTLFTDWMMPVGNLPRLEGPKQPPVTERSVYGKLAEPIGNFLGRMIDKIGE